MNGTASDGFGFEFQMGRHDDGYAGQRKFAEQIHERLRVFRIQMGGGFVGQDDDGVIDDRSRKTNQLTLPCG